MGPNPSWIGLWIWVGLQLLVLPPFAAAQSVHGAARVNTLVDACVPIDHDQFHRVLAIELGTSIEYSPTAAQQPDGAWVRVVCTGDGVQLQLEDSLTRKSMQRVVELPDADVATRSRLLALSVAEFVVASWVELQLASPAIEPSGRPVASEATRQARAIARDRLPAAVRPSSEIGAAPPGVIEPLEQDLDVSPSSAHGAPGSRWLLGASVEPVLFIKSGGLMPQLSLRFEQRPSRHLALGLAFSLGHARWNVRWPMQVVAASQMTNSSARLSCAYLTRLRALELSVGGGARAGIVYFAGDSKRWDITALDMYSPWGGPLVFGAAAVFLGSFRFAVELETGFVTLPVEATLKDASGVETVVTDLSGFWATGGLQAGWLF